MWSLVLKYQKISIKIKPHAYRRVLGALLFGFFNRGIAMAKTQLTRDIEEALYFYGLEQGEIIVEEVSMPDDWGVVDTLACRTKPDGTYEWRCYELKVSKSDFKFLCYCNSTFF